MAQHSDHGTVDDDVVRRYFERVGDAQATASYMAHEVDLPPAAVRRRWERETRILADWLETVPRDGHVLDLGCGAGAWSEYFASRFAQVTAIDRSPAMIRAATSRLKPFENVSVELSDGTQELPNGKFDVIFLGGFCMYQNDQDVIALFGRLQDHLAPGGVIIARESTVRHVRLTADGSYQAIYRTPAEYLAMFRRAGFGDDSIEMRRNRAYDEMNIAGQLVVLRRRWLPFLPRRSPGLGAATWWSLCATSAFSFRALPWALERAGVDWPKLQNHFFRLTQ